MEITEYLINNRYKYNFINSPQDINNIKILFKKQFTDIKPLFSIIMPIYNQEEIIIDNLNSILEFTNGREYEIILILDACSDLTETLVLKWANALNDQESELLTNVLVLVSETPLFETAADNLGLFCARGQYALEIQADMRMTDSGYNMKLLQPFLQDSEIIGMSGRSCQSLYSLNAIGKVEILIEFPLEDIPNIDPNSYYIGDSCNRGPLLFDIKKVRELGYLDEVNYFLEYSEHDLFLRARFLKDWKCGYVPIDFVSNLKDGSTRKVRDAKNEYYFNKYLKEKTGLNGFFFSRTHISNPITKYPLVNQTLC